MRADVTAVVAVLALRGRLGMERRERTPVRGTVLRQQTTITAMPRRHDPWT